MQTHTCAPPPLSLSHTHTHSLSVPTLSLANHQKAAGLNIWVPLMNWNLQGASILWLNAIRLIFLGGLRVERGSERVGDTSAALCFAISAPPQHSDYQTSRGKTPFEDEEGVQWRFGGRSPESIWKADEILSKEFCLIWMMGWLKECLIPKMAHPNVNIAFPIETFSFSISKKWRILTILGAPKVVVFWGFFYTFLHLQCHCIPTLNKIMS